MLCGCALHIGTISSNAMLNTNNFKIVGTAKGEATAKYWLGIGGLGRQGLVNEAKQDLYKNTPLKPNQTLANLTYDIKKNYILIYWQQKAIVTADIVEFTGSK